MFVEYYNLFITPLEFVRLMKLLFKPFRCRIRNTIVCFALVGWLEFVMFEHNERSLV